jgi:hypothetical protein
VKANDYQELAWSTARPFYKAITDNGTFTNLQLATIVLALQNKSGNLAEEIKHMIENGEYVDHNFREVFLDKLGDIQWFVAVASKMLNLTLEQVMQRNISILREKYPTGVMQNK